MLYLFQNIAILIVLLFIFHCKFIYNNNYIISICVSKYALFQELILMTDYTIIRYKITNILNFIIYI